MSEPQAMKATHERSMVAPGHNWRQCEDCAGAVPWPCDASTARSALARIEKLATGWRVGLNADKRVNADVLAQALTDAAKTLRAIRDEARQARGEAGS